MAFRRTASLLSHWHAYSSSQEPCRQEGGQVRTPGEGEKVLMSSSDDDDKKERADGKVLIFVASITVKGKRIYASTYGKRAFAIWVKPDAA